MKFDKKSIRGIVLASIFALSLGFGVMYTAEKNNLQIISQEKSIISDITDRTLNISFVPTNPDMENNLKLLAPISQSDVENIEKVQGVKSVKPIDRNNNPLSGYAKIDSKSSYIEVYGWDESGKDRYKDNVEILYGRNINLSDEGQNVIVLNMQTVDNMQISDAKLLIGTGLELNGAVYEIIGIMNAVSSDTRDVSTEVLYSSLIPKTTSKEVLALASANSNIYTSIMVELEEGVDSNNVETLIYDLLYDAHKNITGFYEKDSDYTLSVTLDPTLTILNNYKKLSLATIFITVVLCLVSLVKLFLTSFTKKSDKETTKDNAKIIEEEVNNESELIDSDEDNSIDEKIHTKKIKGNGEIVENIVTMFFALALSYFISVYYILNMSISGIFNVSIWSKFIIITISILVIVAKLKPEEIDVVEIDIKK